MSHDLLDLLWYFNSPAPKKMSDKDWAKTVTNRYQQLHINTQADEDQYNLDKKKKAAFDNYISQLKKEKKEWEPIKTVVKGRTKRETKVTKVKTKVKKQKEKQKTQGGRRKKTKVRRKRRTRKKRRYRRRKIKRKTRRYLHSVKKNKHHITKKLNWI